MNAKVSFNEVQNYAKTHNVDFKTAAQKLGLTAQEAADLEKLGGDPGAPVDGLERTPIHKFTLRSGRKVEVYQDASGKKTFKYFAADGTQLKEAYFLKQEGLTGSHFAVNNNGQLVTVKNQQQQKAKDEDEPWYSKLGNFVKENAGPLIAGTALVAGAVCCATGVGASVGVPLLLIGGAVGLTSCSPDEEITEFNTNIQVNISIPKEDQSKLIEAFKEGIDALLAKMDELGYKVDEYGDQIIKLLTDNNIYLKNISNSLTEQGYKQDEIIEILTNINTTVQSIEALVAATNENITINGQNISDKLNEILNAIKTGQANTMEALDGYIEELKNLLLDVIANQKEDIQINEENGMTLEQILAELQNMDGMTQDKLEKMLEILASIESIGKDINNKLDIIMGKFDEVFPDNSDIKAALERIEQYLKENNDKTDVTNNLLEQLLNQYNNGGISQEDLQKLLDAIAANGDKIDAIAQLLAKIQDQDEKFQQNILNAINKLGVDITGQLNKIVTAINNISVGGGDTSNLEALLNKVLEKMDSNTTAIIDAISNISVGEGGNVDLSSLEKMLSELLQLTSKNNSLLESIDGKMDVIKLTIEAAKDEIIAHLGNGGGNVDVDAILEKLDEFMSLSNANSEAILKKMDTIINLINNINDSTYDDSALMAKLDDILAAIKDHNITVDITGKVECNCNCGGNHEGILGDLDDILG